MRGLAAALAIAACAAVVLHAPVAAAETTAGRWWVAASDENRVQLHFGAAERTPSRTWLWSWTSDPVEAVPGLDASRLRGPLGPVAFHIEREPGTFACIGSAGNGAASGAFVYTPSARFDDALAASGAGRPTPGQSLQLAVSGVTLAFVDRVRGGSKTATVADVVRALQRGITPRYMADLGAAGYPNLSVDDMVALRDHGVGTAFLGKLNAHGYTNLSVRDLIRLRDAGL